MKQKRKFWSKQVHQYRIQEDKLLKKLIRKNGYNRKGWKKTAKDLSNLGFHRTTKGCRERYNQHITQNSATLPETQLQKLLKNISLYGNKWTDIAEKMGNRTSLDIKNKFYSTVRKIFRRLIKVAFKTKNSTKITWLIKPIVISSIFCNDQNDDPKLLIIDEKVKQLFKNMIIHYKNVKITDELDQKVIDDVIYIVNYLEQESSHYMAKKKKLTSNEQDKILNRIHNRKPIFTLPNCRIEKQYSNAPIIPPIPQINYQLRSDYRDQSILSFASNYILASTFSNYFMPSQQEYYQFTMDSYKNKLI